jgi:hypothetical protein
MAHRDTLREAGAELVLVGTGGAHFASAFAEDQGFDGIVLVDEERRAYRAAALVRSARSTFNLQTFRAGARAAGAGFRQGRTQGDPWQQGGVFVIHPGGRVGLGHVSQHAGDHPEPGDIVRAAAGPG